LEKQSVQNAYVFAQNKHAGQLRKFNNLPYITHPENVFNTVSKYSNSQDVKIAAFLHDVIEDTDTSLDEIERAFGTNVAKLVDELTIPKWVTRETELQFLLNRTLHMSSDALLIKLSDRLHNVSDLALSPQEFKLRYSKETDKIIQNLRNRTLTPSHKELIRDIHKRISPYLH